MKFKITKKLKRFMLPFMAFCASGAIYLIYFAVFGFYPFGERSIAWCDLEQQYVPLLMELRDILLGGGSLLLGKGGGGMNLWGVILFFVSSPIGFLSVFADADKMIYFINILTVLKLAFSGASASLYFKSIFPKLPSSFNLLLSVTYTLSGYVMMYYQNNMWLDMMIVFPLLLLSMFRLCKTGKWGAYCALLSLTMLLNFYISYMIVLFIMLAFGAMLAFCTEKENRGRCAVSFILADIFAALATAVVWLPSMKQFTSSGRGESSADLFRYGSFIEDYTDKIALLSCTSVIFAAVIIMLFKRRIFYSGKAAFFAVATVALLVGTFISPINKIWHTGSYQAYPLRYGFIIILLGLSVCAVLLSSGAYHEKSTRKSLSLIILPLIYIIAVIPALINYEKLSSYADTLWVDGIEAAVAAGYGLLGAAIYAAIIALYNRKKLNSRFAAALMGGVLIGESLLSFSVYVGNVNDVTVRFNQTTELAEKITDESFYRVKSVKRYFYSNMLEGMGFNSIGHYTSLTDRDFLFASKRLGYSAYWLDISTNGGSIITDAFLMNKYLIGQKSDMNMLCEEYNTDGVLGIYRNNAVSEGAVISPAPPEEMLLTGSFQRMKSTELMAEKLYGVTDITRLIEPYSYHNVEYSEKNGEKCFNVINDSEEAFISYSFFVEGRQELYFDIFSNYSTSLTEPYFGAADVYVNGKLFEGNYPNKRSNGMLDLGTFENKYVSIKIVVNNSFSVDEFGLYSLDADKAYQGIASAKTGNITIDGNRITVTAESSGDEWVYIPFAYSDGYSAALNGDETEIYRVLDSFMAIKLQKGENKLTLIYRPQGLAEGIVISCIGIALALLFAILAKKQKYSPKIEKAASMTVIIMSSAVFAAVYIASVIIWLVM